MFLVTKGVDMKRMEELSESIVNLSKSSGDSNRFYSILLDARATTVSENTYDVAERLLRGETDNAKAALEHLWTLKKTMQNPDEVSTLDMLIQYYQKKMDVVRTKEELIRKISRDSRTLLEEKRQRDAEIANVKQEISDCTTEIQSLSSKLEKLNIKEQELTLIDTQLKKELLVNENEIINGLYEIILSQQDGASPLDVFAEKMMNQTTTDAPVKAEKQPQVVQEQDSHEETRGPGQQSPVIDSTYTDDISEIDKEKTSVLNLDSAISETSELLTAYTELEEPHAPPPFPKSVVKTTKGRVIGEYYFDPKVNKNKRHYIFNSRFFLQQLAAGISVLAVHSDAALYAEIVQMVQDAFKRVSENPMMHCEVATNEILNDQKLKDLWQVLKARDYAEATRYCKRLGAKIDALKSNYFAMLKEQMERYASAE
jgi:hypothetical protein